LWTRAQLKLSNLSFQPFLLRPFSQDVAKQWLVEKTPRGFDGPVFTEEEFNLVWNMIGGHQGSIYALHERLLSGSHLEQVLQDYQSQHNGKVSWLVTAEVEHTKARENFLLRLFRNCFSLPLKNVDEDPVAKYFVENNILFVVADTVSPQNLSYQHAIRHYVTTYLQSSFYPYSDLKAAVSASGNSGLDPSKLQDYLLPEEFKQHFEMDYDSFSKLPLPQKIALLKKVGL